MSRTFELAGYKVSHEPKFLSENLILYGLDKQPKHVFIFDRTQARLVEALVASLRERLEAPAAAAASLAEMESLPTKSLATESVPELARVS